MDAASTITFVVTDTSFLRFFIINRRRIEQGLDASDHFLQNDIVLQ
jgi:hypothetical protein